MSVQSSPTPSESPQVEFLALQNFAQISATLLDLNDLLAEALDILADAFRFTLSGIMLIDDDGNLQDTVTRGTIPFHLLNTFISNVDQCIQTGKIHQHIVDELNLRVWHIPLQMGHLVIGVLTVATPQSDSHSPAFEDFLTAYGSQITVAINSAKLYQKIREQQQQELTRQQIAAHLQKLASIINATLDLDDVLAKILKHISVIIPYDYALIMLLNGQTLKVRAFDGFDTDLSSFSIDTAENIFYQQALLQQYPTAFSDITQNTFWTLQHPPFASKTKAWIGAPLVYKKKIIGMLTLHHTEAGYFDNADLDLVHTFANQASIAIDNAQLYQREQLKVRQFQTIAKIGRQTAEIRSTDTLLNTITTKLHDDLDYEFITIFLYNAQHNILTLSAASDLTPKMLVEKSYELSLDDKGIISTVASTQEPLLVNDISIFDDYIMGPGREKVQSEVALPLLTRNGLIGVLDLQSENTHHFSPEDVILVQTIADQITVAIETANLQQQLNEFVQSVSHELRTPLTFIRGYVDFLLEDGFGKLPAGTQKSLNIISERSFDLQRLVTNLVTHQELKLVNPFFQAVDLRKIITQVVESARPTANKFDIKIQTHIATALPLIQADPDYMRQLLDNLIGNAIKFTPEKGRILISAKANDTSVQLSVRDNGIGIEPEKIDKIFQRFYRVTKTSPRNKRGAGLGLTIVKQIVDAHHGTISVKSTPQKGTAFVITFPI